MDILFHYIWREIRLCGNTVEGRKNIKQTEPTSQGKYMLAQVSANTQLLEDTLQAKANVETVGKTKSICGG